MPSAAWFGRGGRGRGIARGGFLLHRLGQSLAALEQHVGIAAGIFHPAPLALRGQGRRRHPVEKVTVVAYEQNRAGIFSQHLLQQIQRLQIEIVRRLIEDQQVGRFGECCRQQQPAALTAR